MTGGSIRNGESGGKFIKEDLVEKVKSRQKRVPGLRCSVEIFW